MKTKDAFIEQWKCHLAGMALYGTVSDKNDGPYTRASKVFDITAEVEKLLAAMYDSIGDGRTPAQLADVFLEAYGKLGPDQRQPLIERFRAAFTTTKATNGKP